MPRIRKNKKFRTNSSLSDAVKYKRMIAICFFLHNFRLMSSPAFSQLGNRTMLYVHLSMKLIIIAYKNAGGCDAQ